MYKYKPLQNSKTISQICMGRNKKEILQKMKDTEEKERSMKKARTANRLEMLGLKRLCWDSQVSKD